MPPFALILTICLYPDKRKRNTQGESDLLGKRNTQGESMAIPNQPAGDLPWMGWLKQRELLLLLVLVSAGFRIIPILSIHNAQYADPIWYSATAAHFAAVGEYGPGRASAWYPPGYPVFLAGVYRLAGVSPLAGKWANAALGVLACVAVWGAGRTLFGARVGLLAGLLLAAWPNVIFHTLLLDSESLAVCEFAVVFWMAVQLPAAGKRFWLHTLLLGAVLGYAILTRPVAMILFPVIGLHWWLTGRSLKGLLLVAAVVTLLVGAWTWRNYVRFGEFIPIATNGGYNFWQGNNRHADGTEEFWRKIAPDDPDYRAVQDADEFTRNREGYRQALNYLAEHPGHFLALIPNKVYYLYHTDTSGLYQAVVNVSASAGPVAGWMRDHQRLVESVTFRYYQTVLLLAAGAILAAPRGTRQGVWPLLSLPVLLTGFHLAFHSMNRYHLPLAPALAILAAVTLTALFRLLSWPRFGTCSRKENRENRCHILFLAKEVPD